MDTFSNARPGSSDEASPRAYPPDLTFDAEAMWEDDDDDYEEEEEEENEDGWNEDEWNEDEWDEYEARYGYNDERRAYTARAPRRFRDEEPAPRFRDKHKPRHRQQLLGDDADFDEGDDREDF